MKKTAENSRFFAIITLFTHILPADLFKLPEFPHCLSTEMGRHFDLDADKMIAPLRGLVHLLHTFSAQTDLFPGLGPGRHFDTDLPVNGLGHSFTAKHSRRKRNPGAPFPRRRMDFPSSIPAGICTLSDCAAACPSPRICSTLSHPLIASSKLTSITDVISLPLLAALRPPVRSRSSPPVLRNRRPSASDL